MPETVNGIRVPSEGDPVDLPGDMQRMAEDVGTAATDIATTVGAAAAVGYASGLDDAKMKTVLDDEEGEFKAGLKASTALAIAPTARRTVYGPRWVFEGDSITINGISSNPNGTQDHRRSWTTELVRLSMGRMRYVRNAAIAGTRTDEMLARFDTAVAPYTPDVVLLTGGTNDIAQARSMSAWLADVAAYRDKCVAINAQLILGEIWPTDDTSIAGRGATTRTWNAALKQWADANGIQVIQWGLLADPITGGWPSGWSTDHIHPTLLDSYSQIGAFAWAQLEPRVGGLAVRRATMNGADLLTNGFFTSLGSVTAAPAGLSATPSTSAGTLPAGTYSYKVTGRTFFGEGLPSAAFTATLSGTGQVSVAASTPSGARGVNVYRKRPSDSDWLFVKYMANGTSPWVDDGTVTPGAAITGVDTSAVPSGLTHGTTFLHGISGPWVFAEPGIRGNIVRFRRSADASGVVQADNDYVAANVTAGQTYVMSCLVRGSGAGEGTVILRWRVGASGGGSAVTPSTASQVYAYQQRFTAGWGLVHVVAVAPTGAASVRVSFETDTTVDYIDVAEIRLDQVSA